MSGQGEKANVRHVSSKSNDGKLAMTPPYFPNIKWQVPKYNVVVAPPPPPKKYIFTVGLYNTTNETKWKGASKSENNQIEFKYKWED